MTESLSNIAELIKNLKELSPKKSLNKTYLEIIKLSVALCDGEMKDLIKLSSTNH